MLKKLPLIKLFFCTNIHILFCFMIPIGDDTHLLQSVLQDFKGLRQVPRLSPSPRRKQRAARGQRQRHQGQRSPDDPQLAHSPPLQNPMHVAADCTAAPATPRRRRRPSETPASAPFQQQRVKSLQKSLSKCPFWRERTREWTRYSCFVFSFFFFFFF